MTLPSSAASFGSSASADRLRHRFELGFDARAIGRGDLAHLGVERRIGEHRLEVGALLLLVAPRADRADDRFELGEFARQRRIVAAAGAPALSWAPISS